MVESISKVIRMLVEFSIFSSLVTYTVLEKK